MRHTAIDLSLYAPPDALDALDYETLLAARKAAFMAAYIRSNPTEAEIAEMQAILDYEYEPLVTLLQQDAYGDLVAIARVNDKVRAVLLATAFGTTLDHIGITYYRTPRLIDEKDDVYRQRLALAPEAWSTCGPDGAYLFYALSASPNILDAAVYSEDEGVCRAPHVRVVILSNSPDGWASDGLCAAVQAELRRADRIPLGDLVTVESAVPLPFDVYCRIVVKPGVSQAVVADQVRARLISWASGRLRWIGDETVGPVWLIGRNFTDQSLAAVARGGDGNIIDLSITIIGETNGAHEGYRPALTAVGSASFDTLAPELTIHLFRAPRLGAITIETEVATGGWFA